MADQHPGLATATTPPTGPTIGTARPVIVDAARSTDFCCSSAPTCYHHHIGSNTRSSRRGPAPGQDTATVRTVEFTMRPAARAAVELRARAAGVPLRFDDTALELDDPWGGTLRSAPPDPS